MKHRDLNIYTPDKKSVVTGYGKHARVVAMQPVGDLSHDIYARVDLCEGLREPTEKEVLAVARKEQGFKGRFKLVRKEYWYKATPSHDSIEYEFKRL